MANPGVATLWPPGFDLQNQKALGAKLKGVMDGALEQWGLGTQSPAPQVVLSLRAGIRAT